MKTMQDEQLRIGEEIFSLLKSASDKRNDLETRVVSLNNHGRFCVRSQARTDGTLHGLYPILEVNIGLNYQGKEIDIFYGDSGPNEHFSFQDIDEARAHLVKYFLGFKLPENINEY